MEHACRMLSLSASLIMTCALIGFGMAAFRESRAMGTEVLDSLEHLSEEYTQYEWMRYEDVCVSGGEVVNVIRKYQKEILVSVVQEGKTYLYQGEFQIANNVPGWEGYIRYADVYRGKVLRDAEEAVSGLQFEKES